jgi:glyoxylase-like metal-dependent hydrolase (beta-lactamase superfamily II)
MLTPPAEVARRTATAPKQELVPGERIADRLHVIRLKKGMKGAYRKGGYSCAYLFEDDKGLTLIDTLYDSDAQQIIDYLWSIGRTPSDLTHIVLTHSHRSHIGGAATLRRLSGARVWCHESEAAIVAGTQSSVPIKPWPLRPLALLPIRVMSYLPFAPHEHCAVDCYPKDGDKIGSLRVIDAPGHTPGNIALMWQEGGRRVLFVADAILTWPTDGAGWPRFNIDELRYQESLWKLIDLKPDIVCVAHGDPILEDATERLARIDPRFTD